MNKITKVLLAILVFFSAASLSSCTQKQTSKDKASMNKELMEVNEEPLAIETIQGDHYIAIAAPLTGPYKELGKSILEGATLAVEEFNETAPNNHKVGTIIIDDGGIVGEALGKADLVIAENALGVVGHLHSSISAEAAKKYSKAKLAMISPASTHPKLTEIPDYKGLVFRTIGTDRQLGDVAAEFVTENPDFKKIAVLYNDKPYGISVASEFVRHLAKSEVSEVVLYQTIPVRTTDHSETAKNVASKSPDLVFFVGEYNDAGYLLKDLKKKLPELQFLAVEGTHNIEFINIAGEDAEGTVVVGTKSLSDEMKEDYTKKYKKEDSGYVRTSYEAAMVLLEAAKANNYKDSSTVASSISSNPIFDPNGDLIKPDFVLYKVKNGKFIEL